MPSEEKNTIKPHESNTLQSSAYLCCQSCQWSLPGNRISIIFSLSPGKMRQPKQTNQSCDPELKKTRISEESAEHMQRRCLSKAERGHLRYSLHAVQTKGRVANFAEQTLDASGVRRGLNAELCTAGRSSQKRYTCIVEANECWQLRRGMCRLVEKGYVILHAN